MKIAIDGRGINLYRGTGIGTYTENLVKALLSIDKENEYYIFWSGNYDSFPINENCHLIMASKKHQRFFEQNYIPSFLKRENIDIYHVPQNGIGLSSSTSSKSIVTIHDLIPYINPETVGRGYLLKFLKEMPQIIENTNHILTVSNWSKCDILKFFPIDSSKITVVPLAANSNYRVLDKDLCKSKIKEKFGIDKDFLLYVGGFSPRKNVKLLIDSFINCFNKFDKEYMLIMPGSIKDEGKKLCQYCELSNVKDNIRFLGYCDECDLPLFYNACSLFVYPSLYEGFGLPPLEAMCCGAPIIVSNTTSIPEVAGDAGIIVKPDQYELCNAMQLILNNPSLMDNLSELSLKRAKKFSWENTAHTTLKCYESLIS